MIRVARHSMDAAASSTRGQSMVSHSAAVTPASANSLTPAGGDEFALAGMTAASCETIDCPRVAEAAASLECRATRIIRQAGQANHIVLGVVTGIHIREDCLRDGIFDLRATGWLARLGHKDYCIVTETFEMDRPA